jgi:hypothetical protein
MKPDPQHRWLADSLVMITTMRADDAARWDPARLVELAQSFSLGGLGFSVGGVTAFYPTSVPDHPVSPSLQGRDLVADTIAALHGAGIRAIGRIDPSLGSPQAYAKYPERFARDAAGNPIKLHDFYLTCPNGEHFRSFMIDVVREIVERFPLDGLWANAAQFSPWSTGRCHCERCRTLFRETFGREFPEKEDWNDPDWKRYNEWRYAQIADWNRLVKAVIDEARPGCAWLPLSQVIESWDHTRKGGWDIDMTIPHADGVVLEAQRRYCNLWWPGMEARYAQGMDDQRGSGITVSYFYPWWRFTHAPVAENRVWAAQMVANGARPWLHITGYFSEYFDRRGLASMRELFRFFREHGEVYESRRSAAEVALVYSRTCLDYLGGAQPDLNYLDGFRGAYNALLDGRLPFDLLSDKHLTAARLARYKAILLPNLACMDDALADTLRNYMTAGGHVVATYRTGFLDAWGEAREEPLIARLLGARYTGETRTDLKAAYAHIGRPGHPVLAGAGDTDILPLAGGVCCFAAGSAGDADVLRLIPPVEARPGSGMSVPEFNAAACVSDIPLLLTRRIGKGGLIYFPWEPDRIGFHFGLRDPMRLIVQALRAAPGWSDLVDIQGPGLIDVSVMDKAGSRVVNLVNFNTHGGMRSGNRRAVEEVIPLHDLELAVRLPDGARCDRVELAVAGADLPFVQEGGVVRARLPKMAEFESVLYRFTR